jgi:ubiquinone/menaquinone biosynthesis C-methylase UbiE
MTMADIGAGDGLVAFRACARVGDSLQVILTDISAPLLAHAERTAIELGIERQCKFLRCSADSLNVMTNESVDVVTTRASLAYVMDKRTALGEFVRVLRPGGRISMSEPVLQDEAIAALSLKRLLEAQPPERRNRLLALKHRWMSAQFPDTESKIAASAIANFSERDMLRMIREAGFVEIHMEMHFDVARSNITSWNVFTGISPHPLAPTLKDILQNQFSGEERDFFEKTLRPQVESGQAVAVGRTLYLTAIKPAA